MFNKADKNKDGKLTPEEWKQVLNSSGVPTTMYIKPLRPLRAQLGIARFYWFCSGRKWTSFSRGWTETMMADSASRNLWGKKVKLKNSSKTWIRMEMAS